MARTLVFGRSGVGKSWFLGWLLEQSIPRFEYSVHFDIEDEEMGLSDPDNPLLHTFYVDEEFMSKEVEYEDRVMPFTSAVVIENNHVRLVPDGLTREEQKELFAELSDLAMSLGKAGANVLLSADEAHNIVPDSGDGLDDRTERMLTGGRKKGVEYILCTQRPSNLHDEAFSQANSAFYFSLTKDVDIARVNGSSNFNAYELLPELAPREFLFEDLDSGTLQRGTSDDFEREREHFAADDGEVDEVLEQEVTTTTEAVETEAAEG